MSYIQIDCEAEEWVRLCHRAATFLAAAFQGVAEQSPEDLDFGSFVEMTTAALTVAVRSETGDPSAIESIKAAGKIVRSFKPKDGKVLH